MLNHHVGRTHSPHCLPLHSTLWARLEVPSRPSRLRSRSNRGDVADPDYLYALQGILAGNGEAQGAYNGSPVIGPPSAMQSPAFAQAAPGPTVGLCRQITPVANDEADIAPFPRTRSVHIDLCADVAHGLQDFTGRKGYLPPAAIDQGCAADAAATAPAAAATGQRGVDAVACGPCSDHASPPVPGSTSRPKTLTPMTPASLMNLGKADAKAEPQSDSRRQPPPSALQFEPQRNAQLQVSPRRRQRPRLPSVVAD
jgi:hypothetical protein